MLLRHDRDASSIGRKHQILQQCSTGGLVQSPDHATKLCYVELHCFVFQCVAVPLIDVTRRCRVEIDLHPVPSQIQHLLHRAAAPSYYKSVHHLLHPFKTTLTNFLSAFASIGLRPLTLVPAVFELIWATTCAELIILACYWLR
jgi:hypothetical protein